MPENKKIAAPEVPVQEQQVKITCPACGAEVKLTKVCPECNHAYTEENNYCTHCGAKLKNITLPL